MIATANIFMSEELEEPANESKTNLNFHQNNPSKATCFSFMKDTLQYLDSRFSLCKQSTVLRSQSISILCPLFNKNSSSQHWPSRMQIWSQASATCRAPLQITICWKIAMTGAPYWPPKPAPTRSSLAAPRPPPITTCRATSLSTLIPT